MVVVRLMIEILGSPKEHVEKVVVMLIERIKKEKDIEVLQSKAFEAKEVKKLWTSFCELELRFKGLGKLIGFCFDYMPSSVEILEPDNLGIESSEMANLLNDLLARLHEYDMMVKRLKAENILLKRKSIS